MEEAIRNKRAQGKFKVLEPQVILFDGVCNLCNGAVDFIIRHDREANFMFASLQSEVGQELLQQYGLPAHDYKSMVLLKEGRFYQRSTAALKIAEGLGGALRLLRLFLVVPAPFRDAVYNFVAHNRYRFFGKKETCRLPTPEERARFLG